MEKTHTDIVQFDRYGTFEVVAPGLQEIVAVDALRAVAGGNFGCTRIGPRNTNCFNDFCHNGTCINVAC